MENAPHGGGARSKQIIGRDLRSSIPAPADIFRPVIEASDRHG